MAHPTRPVFGVLLRRYRRSAALTQQQLAERAGYSAVHVGMLERGQRRANPIVVTLLADALVLQPRERALLEEAAHQAGVARPAAVFPPVQPLVGREREIEALEQHVMRKEPPVLLLLAGEPGIGKTRLLRETATRGTAHGWQTLAGGCRRRGRAATQWEGETYAPLIEALTRYLDRRTPAQRTQDLAGCAWLARLLPELAEILEPVPAWTLPAEQVRRQVVGALGHFLSNVAGPAGTLLLLDDLQWAGPDTLEVLAALLRETEIPLRLVGAYRATDVEPGDPLAVTLAALTAERLASVIPVGPLAPAEAGRLLDHSLKSQTPLVETAGDAARARILERAGGVPFALVSYAQALRAGADGDTIPWDLAQSVRSRITALSVEAREALEVMAVVGREAPLSLPADVLAWPRDEALATLQAATRARLLEERAASYRFAHDVIREVVEESLSPERRRTLHRRVAQALERAGAPAETLAHHYGRSDMLERAVIYLEVAGERAQGQAAYAAAEGYYREAIAGLAALGQTHVTARVQEKLAGTMVTRGHYDEALRVLEQAAQVYRAAGDLDGEGRVIAHIGTVHSYRGTPGEAVERVRAALRRCERRQSPPSQTLAQLSWALYAVLMTTGRREEQLQAAQRAAERARAAGDTKTLIRAQRATVSTLLTLGRRADARRTMEELIPPAEAYGDIYLLTTVLDTAAQVYLYDGALEQSSIFWQRALALAERTGDRWDVAFDAGGLGLTLFFLGKWGAARAALERAVAMIRSIDSSWYSAHPHALLARLCLSEGRWEEAFRHLADAAACADTLVARTLQAEHDLLAGDAGRALTWLDHSPAHTDPLDPLTALALPVRAWAYLEQGDDTRALIVAEHAVAHAAAENRLALADALRVQAMALTRLGRHGEAGQALEEGLALARAMPYPYGEARLLSAYGMLLLEQGEPVAAGKRLHAALAIFRLLGARKEVERTEEIIAHVRTAWTRRADRAVTGAQWAMITVLLPPPARTGRPRADDRRTLEAILYVQRTGCAWAGLPAELGDGRTAYRRLRQWQASGVWERISTILHDGPQDAAGPVVSSAN